LSSKDTTYIKTSTVVLKMAKKKSKKRDRIDQVTGPSSTDITAKSKHKKKSKKRKSNNDPSSSKQQSSTSLAQLLKKHRGVAADTAPPPIWKDTRTNNSSSSFLTPKDNPQAFKECLQTSYAGFHYDKPEALPSSLHNMFDSSFGGMDKGGLFLYDVVQPGKKRLTRTSVTRCLVGDPGSTYKYLGLRLFSHPWTDVDNNANSIQHTITGSSLKKLGYSDKTTSALISMGCINSTLTKRSKAMLQEHVSINPVGSADYNLTLVNKMEATSTKKDLKQENVYGMGKTSVGWHRDSGLRDFSSIAVYFKVDTPSNESQPWGVALRAMDGGSGGVLNDVPPLVVPLPSGSLYYMLDDFNHNHEHAVIAGGGGIRYSSTHRVAREGAGTWQYIRDKVQSFLSTMEQFDMEKGIVKDSDSSTSDQSLRKRSEKKLISHVRAQQNLLTEIEFEWIRQFYVQGKRHASLHPYWHDPIKILTESFGELEEAASKLLNLLSSSQETIKDTSQVTEDLYDVLIEAYTERSRLRSMWTERYRDPIFDNIPKDEQPIPCPCLGKVEDTDEVVSKLRHWRSTFVDTSSDGPHEIKKKSKRKKKSKNGSLTKKESKSRSSNWEKLKATMK